MYGITENLAFHLQHLTSAGIHRAWLIEKDQPEDPTARKHRAASGTENSPHTPQNNAAISIQFDDVCLITRMRFLVYIENLLKEGPMQIAR